MEFKAALPRLLTKACPLLPVLQLPRDTRKLKTDLLRTRPVSWTLLTSHNSQWGKKTAAASLPQFKSCSCKEVAEPKLHVTPQWQGKRGK